MAAVGAGTLILGSVSIALVRVSIWSKPDVQMMKWFSVFNGPIKFGAGAKNW